MCCKGEKNVVTSVSIIVRICFGFALFRNATIGIEEFAPLCHPIDNKTRSNSM